MINSELISLKEQIVSEANLVQIMLDNCIAGLVEKNEHKLQKVFELEQQINIIEVVIDQLCTNIIARFQPEAKHLRTALMIFKINSDLERMADHTVNIAGSAKVLILQTPLNIRNVIPEMAKITRSMVADVVKSFLEEDVALARDICTRDDLVDNLNKHIISRLIDDVKSDVDIVERAFHVLRISRNLERIADLTTNIAEEVTFMVEGSIIKHNN